MDKGTTPAKDVMRLMLDTSGLSAYRLSLDLGRSRNWAINSLGSDPLLSTVAEVASATGHTVAILDAKTDKVLTKVQPPQAKAKAKPKDRDA